MTHRRENHVRPQLDFPKKINSMESYRGSWRVQEDRKRRRHFAVGRRVLGGVKWTRFGRKAKEHEDPGFCNWRRSHCRPRAQARHHNSNKIRSSNDETFSHQEQSIIFPLSRYSTYTTVRNKPTETSTPAREQHSIKS